MMLFRSGKRDYGLSVLPSSQSIDGGDFSVAGVASLPAGMTYSRASVGTCQTGPSTVIDLATDQAGVAYSRHGYTGLQLEAGDTNILRQNRALATTPWGNTSGVTADAATAPDGTATADRCVASSGVVAAYQPQAIASGGTYTVSGWIRPHGGAAGPYQIALLRSPGPGMTILSSGWLEATDGWRFFSGTFSTDSTANQFAYVEQNTADWSTLATSVDNGIKAMAEDVDLWGMQLAQVPFRRSIVHTTTGAAACAPGYLRFSDASKGVRNGRMSLHIRCVPQARTTDYAADWYLFYIDGSNYARVNASTCILTVVIGGSTVFTAGTALDWWQERPLDLWLRVGNGATVFAWQKWGSGWTVLTGSSVGAISFGAVPIYVLSGSLDHSHFYCKVQSVRRWSGSYNPATNTAVRGKVNLVCDGNSLTAGVAGPSTVIGRMAEQLLRTTGEAFTVDYSSAVSGQTLQQMIDRYPTYVAPKFNASARRNILTVWEGTNQLLSDLLAMGITSAGADTSPAVNHVIDRLQAYCALARATGWQIVLADVIARGQLVAGAGVPDSFEPARLALNAWIAANWSTIADRLAQLGNHSKLGSVATTADVNWYSDYVHTTNLGCDVEERLFAAQIESLAA